MCGRDGDDRFNPVDIGLLLESLARFNSVGMLQVVIRMPRDFVETEILRACGIIYVQTMDLTDEARRAVFRVAKELYQVVQPGGAPDCVAPIAGCYKALDDARFGAWGVVARAHALQLRLQTIIGKSSVGEKWLKARRKRWRRCSIWRR
jgi:hypothetical protein